MKKLLVVLGVVTFGLYACKKDWMCECSANGISGSYEIYDTPKKRAISQCEGQYITEEGDTLSCVMMN